MNEELKAGIILFVAFILGSVATTFIKPFPDYFENETVGALPSGKVHDDKDL